MKRQNKTSQQSTDRRGSTLVIVIALLGLLSFTGIVFYTFAAQEKAASQYFSEAAKSQVSSVDEVFDWGLRHVLVGPTNNERNSILYSPTSRFSLIRNMFGNDISPYNGEGVPIDRDPTTGVPFMAIDQDDDGIPDYAGGDADFLPSDPKNLLHVVDSIAAWGLNPNQQIANQELSDLFRTRGLESGAMPAPDVDYTYPDINNMFLAYRGFAIRDNSELPGSDRNGNGSVDVDSDGDGLLDIDGSPRYELVPITIPSFLRPGLMKTAGTGFGGNSVPMDPNWATADPTDLRFVKRSFRPHPAHLVRNQQTGAVANRYFRTAGEATAAGVISGPFPFVPANLGTGEDNASIFGECGLWTGSWPTVVELDVDNDQFDEVSNGTTNKTREGIWLDLHFPLQEHVDSGGNTRTYAVLHSFTIYDLDSLINVNVHGNINNLTRAGDMPTLVSNGQFQGQMLSASHSGIGPHEINPNYVLRRDTRPFSSGASFDSQISAAVNAHFTNHYTRTPQTVVEQANMEWFWLLTGRADFNGGNIDDIFPGRWGDIQSLYFALNNGGNIAHYPRPGRSDGQRTIATGDRVSYGGDLTNNGTLGYDDNQDRYEGEPLRAANRRRPFGHPLDFGGTGRRTTHTFSGFNGRGVAVGEAGNALQLLASSSGGSAVWPMYDGYNVVRGLPTATAGTASLFPSQRYIFGMNQTLDNASGDDLITNPVFDLLFEDPLETVFDPDRAVRPADFVFGSQDTFELHMTSGDISGAKETPSQRLSHLAPWSLDPSSRNREMLTAYSNSYRYVPFRHPFGNDGRPGQRGVDDDGDGVIDNIEEVLISVSRNSDTDATNNIDTDTDWRVWEWSADSDGADRNGDGFPDGDGNLEFPPNFGTGDGRAYRPDDPFRPQVRRTIQVEAGDGTSLVGQLMLSPNHIVDVDRQWDEAANAGNGGSTAPLEGTPEFLRYMQRSGLRFRPLTDHPHLDETDVADETDVFSLNVSTTASTDPFVVEEANEVRFPPELPSEREFWARRDRQQLARDIYVLLYTLGGGRMSQDPTRSVPVDYTGDNNPTLAENAADPGDASLPHPEALYTHEQLRRMAQFAVNLVDAMDPDDVVTKFEYDKNLGNGWNLDDDPYSEDFPPMTRPAPTNSNPLPLEVQRYNVVTGGGLYPEDSGVFDSATGEVTDAERGVVYGVEGQQLAFNEVFRVRSPQLTVDHPATLHNDTIGVQDFLHIELQNVTPLNIDIGKNSDDQDNCIWRIARFDRETGVVSNDFPIASPNDFQRAIVLLRDAMTDSEIPGGGRMTIATGSPNLQAASGMLNLSDFYVDYDNSNNYATPEVWERISPDIDGTVNDLTTVVPGPGNTVLPGCDVDLHFDDHITTVAPSTAVVARVLADDTNPQTDGTITGTKGAFLEDLREYAGNDILNDASGGNLSPFSPTGADPGFELVLQRRVNPHMPNLSQTANPWVEVDRVRVEFNSTAFNIQDTTSTTADVEAALSAIASQERSEPLRYQAGQSTGTNAATNFRYNTIANENSTAVPWTLHQLHFDRDFASASELLNLPLFPPSLLTQRMHWTRRNPQSQGHNQAPTDDPTSWTVTEATDRLRPEFLSTADSMFLLPDFMDIPGGAPEDNLTNAARDNRWYRILQFVEVPSRVHRMLGNYLNQTRLPGKLNLNMIRHREVFAGLIDDPFLMDVSVRDDTTAFYNGAPPNPPNSFPDGGFTNPAGAFGAGARDRFREFVQQRDETIRSFDPGGTNVPAGAIRFTAPGIPGARPFRTLGRDGGNGIEDTVLRELLDDTTVGDTNRRWFEVGSVAEHQGGGNGATSSALERQQLLSKILNNTTTVSNTFIVFASAGAFEAVENPTTGLVQVGGPYTGDVFDSDGDPATIDHRRAIFLIDRTEALNAFDAGSGDFDWKRLIKARLDIE